MRSVTGRRLRNATDGSAPVVPAAGDEDPSPDPRPRRVLRISLAQRFAIIYERSVLLRLMSYCLGVISVGAIVLYLAERGNEGYETMLATVENIAILFTSGFDVNRPKTLLGTLAAFTVLATGICFLGLFTGEIAAYLVERRMKGGSGMKPVTVSDHVVVTRWGKETESIIDELLSDEVKERHPVVVIDRSILELPINNPYVHFVKGDPTESAVLERAGILRASTAIILPDLSTTDYMAEDSRTILTVLAIESLNRKVYTVAQVLVPENAKHLERVHCDEIICTTEVCTRLMVQSSLQHGLSRIFADVLSFGEGSEIYRVKLAGRFAGREYFELGAELMRTEKTTLLAIESDRDMHINPEKEVRVKAGDHAFVLSPSHPTQIEV